MMILGKPGKQRLFAGLFVMALLLCVVVTGCSTIAKTTEEFAGIDGRIIDGAWEMEGEPDLRIFFYANTFFIADARMYLSDDYFLPGIFVLDNEYLTLKMEEDIDMRIKYTAGEDYVVFSEALWLNGRWNKVDMPEFAIDPLVGMWKGETRYGRILIFNYLADGYGFHYSYNPDLSGIRVCFALYDLEDSTILSYPIRQVAQVALDDDDVLFITNFSLEDGEVVETIFAVDEFEIVGDELILKSRSDMVCRRI